MHYSIDYSGLTNVEAHNQAISDIKEYVGDQRYIDLTNLSRANGQISLDTFRMMISFAGVQGFPARAWYNEIWPFG
jgi:hypothetical protein